MRKNIFLPVLALAGGAAGFFLRRWQTASAYVPGTGLYVHGAPATLALLGLVAALAVLFLLLSLEKREGISDFLPAFGCPGTGQMTFFAAAGLLMMAAGVWGLWSNLDAIQQWQTGSDEYQLSALVSRVLAAALCLPAGNGVLLMGRMAYRGEMNDTACRLASFPALAGLVWLFSSHLQSGTEPVLMKYGFHLAAVLLLTLAHYYIAAFLFGRPHPRRTAFLALMGTAVGIISLADRPSLFTAIATLAFSLSALTFAHALLAAPWPDRMPPAEEEKQDE